MRKGERDTQRKREREREREVNFLLQIKRREIPIKVSYFPVASVKIATFTLDNLGFDFVYSVNLTS
jgi:hypothetical protein